MWSRRPGARHRPGGDVFGRLAAETAIQSDPEIDFLEQFPTATRAQVEAFPEREGR